MTSFLHTARISGVESILCGDGVGKMVNFELGRQIKKERETNMKKKNIEIL